MLFWFWVMPVNAGNGRFNSKRESVGLVKRVVPSKPGHLIERVRQQLVAEAAAAAQRDVALRLECRRRLVVGVEAHFQVVAAAARVGHFE